MKVYGVIPARIESTRLPRKLLLNGTGKPLIQHTWERAKQSNLLTEIFIATDSREIFQAAEEFGARCEFTGKHPSGTDRIAEVALRMFSPEDIVVNIQGDEPQVDPLHLDNVAQALVEDRDLEMATLAVPIRESALANDPSCVKVVVNSQGNALYFSRASIPHCRDVPMEDCVGQGTQWKQHVGVYGYRVSYLEEFTRRPPSHLELLERLEQLRALEAGTTIRVIMVDNHKRGIDTPKDYQAFLATFVNV